MTDQTADTTAMRPLTSRDLEQAYPFPPGRFDEAEPQQARGAPGSRDLGEPVERREQHGPREWTGVNPQGPILPGMMPMTKPGDQGG